MDLPSTSGQQEASAPSTSSQQPYREEAFVPLEFINPNICHLCKKKFSTTPVICHSCFLISYCTEKERIKDQHRHVHFCARIKKLTGAYSVFSETTGYNEAQWIHTKKRLLRLMKVGLNRDLEPHEVEMITLAKSCVICREQWWMNLSHCQTCFSANYCNEHENQFQERHSYKCPELKLCFDINMSQTHRRTSRPLLKFVTFPMEDKPYDDMKMFINNYVAKRYADFPNWHHSCYFYSDYVSGPLTLIHRSRKIRQRGRGNLDLSDSSCVIHIIAANFVDRKYIAAWELLLHCSPSMKDLKVILIGQFLRTEEKDILELCTHCRLQRKQTLSFETHRTLYHLYVNSEKYTKPNVIIGFQVDLNDWEAFSETFLKIKDQHCPLFLTAKSEHKVEQIRYMMNDTPDTFPLIYELVYNEENKFSSQLPYRDFENDWVFYRNKYLLIYDWYMVQDKYPIVNFGTLSDEFSNIGNTNEPTHSSSPGAI